MDVKLSEIESNVLLHTLGLDYYPRIDQNFFGTGIENENGQACKNLETKGLMVEVSSPLLPDGEKLFRATSEGRRVAFQIEKRVKV